MAMLTSAACLLTQHRVHTQAAGVPIGRNVSLDTESLGQRAAALKDTGSLLTLEAAEQQLRRTNCVIASLPRPGRKLLPARHIWQRARASFVRIGWCFLCPNCDKRHINFGGGFYITKEGVAATAFHVIAPGKGMREGYLVAASEDGTVTPVLEILAANEAEDTALVRIKPPGRVVPLALNSDVFPGDTAWCYSTPLERPHYFSQGTVTRFIDLNTSTNSPPRIRMGVSTEWAPGSSGAAVLDARGNAIGLVSALEVMISSGEKREQYMTLHHAACAANVLRLITRPR